MPSATSKATSWLRNSPAPPARGWHALRFHWGKDAQLALFVFVTLALFRPLLIAIFRDRMAADSGLLDVARAVATGLRYDLSTAGAWVLPGFVAALGVPLLGYGRGLCTFRRLAGRAFVWFALPVAAADLVFFHEYGDQFDQHLFGLFTDDLGAILGTIWKSYHPLLVLGLLLPVLIAADRMLRLWLDYHPPLLLARPLPRPGRNLAHGILALLALAAAVRGGSLWGEPVQMKHAFVSRDSFLNHTVLNPVTALREALETKWRIERQEGLAELWPSRDLRGALKAAFSRQDEDLDAALAVTARGSTRPPRHIFLLLMESQDGWTLLPAYRHLGFAPALSALADRGLYFPHMLPNASGTIGALHALIDDLPDTGLDVNYEARSLTPYPTSVATTFRELGYRTRLFYGGFLGWQRIDAYATAQGFQEIYGGGQMDAGSRTNEWGVADALLYDFILRTVDDAAPSFNLILTTSNHPPYDIDLAREGFPFAALPAPLEATKSDTLKVLGHHWYADREAGRFVAQMEQRLPATLFAITGDHTARLRIRFPGDSQFEQVAVPFILYGPQVLAERRETLTTAGSHIDITPTLYELSAPAGFRYNAFGTSMLHKEPSSFGIGHEHLLAERYIAATKPVAAAPTLYRLAADQPPPQADPALPPALERARALRALAWYRVREGAKLPSGG